ncbi:cytosolic phospholipase A2 gamma-like [Aquarana catesbeiana]|uniref:cytosolic phospholipase A2 gamma-like n=1 Tax=Aquarana catesbeiana TaxID=8400 RepID=UPI003CC98580
MMKQGETRSKMLLALASQLLTWTEQNVASLSAVYLKGSPNLLADLLSRRKLVEAEWSLNQEVFLISKAWGQTQIDLFANKSYTILSVDQRIVLPEENILNLKQRMSFQTSTKCTEIFDVVDGLEEETLSIKARKRKVTKTLSSLGMNVGENADPPVIAVLGSGGGFRAMVGFLGAISKLAELNLLGAVTYIGGISGSTWCMSSLYSESNWSDFSRMKALEIRLCERMKSETERHWTEPWEKLKEKFLGDFFSLTDFWAYTFVFSVTNRINEEKLSSHQKMCEDGEDPYPIYSAVAQDKIHENDLEAWFEFTPHKSGFPSCQSYVKTEHLGCRFKEGRLLEKLPEHNLIYLQGLWGSAPGADWVKLFVRETYKKVIRTMTGAKDQTMDFFSRTQRTVKKWITGEKEGDNNDILFYFITAIAKKSWSDYIQEVYNHGKVVKNLTSCFAEWKWGTTNNFLYKCKAKIPENCPLFRKKQISLVDAGLEINAPYPLVLPPYRKVDLILSFDFSQGDPFETVKKTAEYCKAHWIPFPKNTEESYECPPTKSCYIFGDGNETPDVMHFPLFNTQTCGDAEKIGTLSKKYATRVHHYDSSMMNELLDIAKKNVESNLDQIKVKIQQCVWRSNKREMSQT